jgi:hypothetical protein
MEEASLLSTRAVAVASAASLAAEGWKASATTAEAREAWEAAVRERWDSRDVTAAPAGGERVVHIE